MAGRRRIDVGASSGAPRPRKDDGRGPQQEPGMGGSFRRILAIKRPGDCLELGIDISLLILYIK